MALSNQMTRTIVSAILAIMLSSSLFTASVIQRQCRHRPDHMTWNHSLLPIPTDYERKYVNDSIYHQYGVCPRVQRNNQHVSAQSLSLCPWTEETDIDEHRLPEKLHYAKCNCRYCHQRSSRSSTFMHSDIKVCEPVYRDFKVIKRSCSDNNFQYYYAYVRLPIACVCSHQNVNLVTSPQE